MDTLYKKGDKVRIQSEQWYLDNMDEDEKVLIERTLDSFTEGHSRLCGEIMTIAEVDQEYGITYYTMVEDKNDHIWVDEMIECLVERADTMVSLEKICEYLKKYPSVDIKALKKYLQNN